MKITEMNLKSSLIGYFSLAFLARIITPSGTQLRILPSKIGSETNEYNPDTSNFIFASFAGLLQEWPNAYAYTGHSMIPGLIPTGTVLYRGTNNHTGSPTEGMEWLAFDPELSYLVHSLLVGPVHLYTYVTTRPLRVLYIDGQSASLGSPGYLDSQYVLINGTVPKEFLDADGHWTEAEYVRGHQLCEIGKTHGFEGIVRMNTGFEVLWCDFKEGLELIQVVNATDPFYGFKAEHKNPGNHANEISTDLTPGIFYPSIKWIFSEVATRYYQPPGEVRVRLDPSGFVSFYDGLKSLALKRRADGTEQGPRSRHRLYGISSKDANQMRDRLFAVLASKKAHGWDIDPNQPDLQGIVLTIIRAYTKRLIELRYLLNREDVDAMDKAIEVRILTYQVLIPYLDFSSTNLSDSRLATQTINRCRTAYTQGIRLDNDHASDSIRLIVHATDHVLTRLCTTFYDIFSQSFQITTNPHKVQLEARSKASEWRTSIRDLMHWLGWSSWEGCDPDCKPNEICMIRMWPSGRPKPINNHTRPYPVCLNSSSWEPWT